MDIDDLIINAMEKDPLKIQDAVNHLMVQKAAEMVGQRRDEMTQSIFGGVPEQDVDMEQPEDNSVEDQDTTDDIESFTDDDIEEFLDQNLDDLLQDLDNIEAENDEEASQ